MSLHKMDSDSPSSTPGTPRTASPSPVEDELTSTSSPSQDDAHAIFTQVDPDREWEGVSGTRVASASPTTRDATTRFVKGKEKARRGPLKLLDLPVDILKEIIHQVSSRPDLE